MEPVVSIPDLQIWKGKLTSSNVPTAQLSGGGPPDLVIEQISNCRTYSFVSRCRPPAVNIDTDVDVVGTGIDTDVDVDVDAETDVDKEIERDTALKERLCTSCEEGVDKKKER